MSILVTEKNFKPGLQVKIHDDSEFRKQGHENDDITKPKMIGVILSDEAEEGWCYVKWSNGDENMYQVDNGLYDLELYKVDNYNLYEDLSIFN